MSAFEDLVLAVDLARRDLGAGVQDSWPVVLLRTMTSEQARPRAASFALVCIDRWARVLPPGLPSDLGGDLDEMVEKLVNETVRLPSLSISDAASAHAWLVAFDESIRAEAEEIRRQVSFTAHIPLPQRIVSAMVRAQSGADPEGASLLAGADGPSWQLTSQSDEVVLVVPARGDAARSDLRELLSGSVLRTWWATWALALEQRSRDGFFQVDLRHVILDLFQMKPVVETKNGRRYFRAPRETEKQVRHALSVLEQVRVSGIGTLTVDNPEPLIHRYGTVREGQRVLRKNQYAHARLAWAARRYNFLQLPRAAFRLRAPLVPMAMGLATLLRSRTSTWLGAGALSMTLQELALGVGEDVNGGVRRRGRAYWDETRRRIEEMVLTGGFGTLRVGPGDGGAARVSLTPFPPLAAAYSKLAAGARDAAQLPPAPPRRRSSSSTRRPQ